MNEIIEQLWVLPWWEIWWIYLVMQWVTLVRFWPYWVGVVAVRVLIWWRWEK